MNKTLFTGVATAIATPMTTTGEVDYKKFFELVEFQIAGGVDAIVFAGTTGEASTLSDAEHKELLEFGAKTVNGRLPIIAGTGSNDIAYAKSLTTFACDIGYDGVLVVTPYYNKATQNGLIKSFTEIADTSTKPVILYNVPSRTGCNILPSTAAVLADHPNICGIKEASGNISQIAETAHLTRGKMDIYSGNDDQIVPILALGGKGVISVVSNILPKETAEICKRFFAGDVEGSAKLQLDLLPLMNTLFCEVNPIPVKAALAKMGFTTNTLRLPMTSLEAQHEDKLFSLMREAGINI